MPNVDIKSLHMQTQKRALLTDRITRVLTKHFNCPAEAVTMQFEEVSGDRYAVAGKLLPKGTDIAHGPDNQMVRITLGYYDKRDDKTINGALSSLADAVTQTFHNLKRESVEIDLQPLHSRNHSEGGKRVNIPPRKTRK